MKTILFTIFFLISITAFILFVIALIKPKAKILKRLLPQIKTRKSFTTVLLPLSFVSIIVAGVVAPPTNAEIKSINIAKSQEVLAETFTIEGDTVGKFDTFTINNEKPTFNGTKFSKELTLKPGDNSISLLATSKKDDKIVEVKKETYRIYFDYEAMLYAEQLKKDHQEAAELQRKLSLVLPYEIVRKDKIDGGFSAILYVDGEPEDYLVTNVIKDFKSKNKDKNISLLVFKKADKVSVEQILESEDAKGLAPLVRANYEKRNDTEQLFLFPTGLSGNKLAVEI